MHVHSGAGAIVLEPVARNTVGGEGRVDIYSVRTFRRLLLIANGDAWDLYTDDRVKWPEPWNEESFATIAQALTAP